MMKRPSGITGFTLTETAIVLGVLGIALGSMWIASSNYYTRYNILSIEKNVSLFLEKARVTLAKEDVNNATSTTLTDQNCPNGNCFSLMLHRAGVFPPGYINVNRRVPASTYTTGRPGDMFVSSDNTPIWTGLFDCSLYVTQSGGGLAPTCRRRTVIELDIFKIYRQECAALLMHFVNTPVDGLFDVSTPSNGWGPVTGWAYGNNTLPKHIDSATASEACKVSGSVFTYMNGPMSYIWLIFDI